MAPHQMMRQTCFFAQFARFVLIQLVERFNHLALGQQLFNNAHAIVMRFDNSSVIRAA